MLRALAFVLLLVSGSAQPSPVIAIAEPWIRPAPAGAASELYLEVRASERASLVAVRSPAATRAQFIDRGGKVMAAIELPPATLVRLQAGSVRVRLSGLLRRVARGGHVPVILTVRDAAGVDQEIPLEAEVRLHSPSQDHGVGHTHPT